MSLRVKAYDPAEEARNMRSDAENANLEKASVAWGQQDTANWRDRVNNARNIALSQKAGLSGMSAAKMNALMASASRVSPLDGRSSAGPDISMALGALPANAVGGANPGGVSIAYQGVKQENLA